MDNLKWTELKLGDENFENPRMTSGLDKQSIRELADDIKHRGLLYPLLVWKDPEGQNLILGGQRRYRALGLLIEEGVLDGEQVPVIFYGADSLQEAQGVALADGLHRKQLSSFEVAKALVRMEGSQTDIASQIGKSITYVSRALKTWHNSGPALLVAWEKGTIPYTTVKSIAELPPNDQASAVVSYINGEVPKPRIGKKTGPKGQHGRPSIKTIKEIVAWSKEYEPVTAYEQGLADMAKFVSAGVTPKDDRWRKYLEE